MSDDRYLGYAFRCFPRRLFILLLGASLCIYSFASIIFYALFNSAIMDNKLSQANKCEGHKCFDVLTCAGMVEASYHIREVSQIVLGLIFGYWGYTGAANSYPDLCERFAYYLFFIAFLHCGLAVFDGGYTLVCDAYPFNVVEKALLWPTPDIPVRNTVKYEIFNTFAEFPVDMIDTLTGHAHVWRLYFIETTPLILLWAYAGHTAILLSQVMAFGVFGLGANYSIQGWRASVVFKNEMREKFKETVAQAKASAEDIGWQPPKHGGAHASASHNHNQGRGYGSVHHVPISIEADFHKHLEERGDHGIGGVF